MCIDYIDLNKACLKDEYPLYWIDLLLDTSSSHELLMFTNIFSKYN